MENKPPLTLANGSFQAFRSLPSAARMRTYQERSGARRSLHGVRRHALSLRAARGNPSVAIACDAVLARSQVQPRLCG
jgi:hypothetical protein